MTTAQTSAPPVNDTPLTEAERGAMRAYLQRCEVRLSTLHRIATAFIGGAGLLLLIPVFIKDAVDGLLGILLTEAANQFESLGSIGFLPTAVLYICLVVPLFLSLAIPLYGVYLLLKDIVHFYFTIYAPGFAENVLNPTFALTGVMFSKDESPRAKEAVMRYEYEATQMGFMIPFSKERSELYFDSMLETTNGSIVPETRTLENLKSMDVLPHNYDPANVSRFNTALGIARSLDRTLAEEVAVTEMSLARHVLYLRRLMFRYVKTLLMFIWTTVVSFVMLPLVKDPRIPAFLVLGIGYLVWASQVMRIMEWPIYWIYKHRRSQIPMDHIDPMLRLMQDTVSPYTRAAIVLTLMGIILAFVSLGF